ncbi:MAG: polyphosphate kinase 2 family protein [Betaproteobacteria bacterium]|nr:polyphosphate kinase 2 family protein [Betaproteobacteria bacterium]
MSIDMAKFRVLPDAKLDLSLWPTRIDPVYASKADYQSMLTEQVTELSALQELHYAASRYSILLIFQAMDAAGKDSTIRHVMSGVNPQGCQVFSFKHPSEAELAHDFLWRTTRDLPERGRIGIFNRSYYEEVLIVRVHPEMLRNQYLPEEDLSSGRLWHERYRSIVEFENHLYRNGTRVVKFFLHLSEEEQRKRFIRRIDEPKKNWKLSMADIEERQYWKQYQSAYQDCLAGTSTTTAPWYAIPADDKENARLMVAAVVLHTLRELKLEYPEMSDERLAELQTIRAKLAHQ